MFSASTYSSRRAALASSLGSGTALFLGNKYVGMNYAGNTYPFRQDSNFLYFFGIDRAGLAATIDLATGEATVFGDELSMDDIVWTGELPTIAEQAAAAGVAKTAPFSALEAALHGKEVLFTPPYRFENTLLLSELLGFPPRAAKEKASLALIQAIVGIRSYKTDEEIVQLEIAVRLTNRMHLAAMRAAKPGLTEAQVHAAVVAEAVAADASPSFPVILTTDGAVLHNHHHHNTLASGKLLLCDAGGLSPMQYAGDMTRTFPVDPTFNTRQREVYGVALASQEAAIAALRPGIAYRDVHLLSARTIAQGMKDLGLMKGDVDEAVAAGAHALFFQHGLGHMMGLDVHDMEDLGEDHVGYNEQVKRSEQFGLAFLRLGRALEPGFVVTVEPGIYFIPQLIDMWRAEGKHAEFINYEAVESYKDFGGIRIEDDYLITSAGARLLGDPVPKGIAELEALRG